MDIATPRNAQLSGFYRRSNAVMNATERIPNCLSVIVGELSARLVEVRDQNGTETADELKEIINKIDFLRYEIIEDFPFRPLVSTGPDVKFYNDYLEKITSEDCTPTMLNTKRIYSECYVYRRIWECFEISKYLKNFDPYDSIKENIFWWSLPIMRQIAQYLKNIYKYPNKEDKNDFEKLIKLNLWSNQSDFIMSRDFVLKSITKVLFVKKKDPLIVLNELDQIWEIISDRNHAYNSVAFVCDNCGLDLFMNMCIADYLYTNHYARTIYFHVKHIPWFVSDVTEKDICWTIQQLTRNLEKPLQELSHTWKEHFKSERWKVIARKYWTLPIGFNDMQEMDPILYKMLEHTKMIIVIGDLNYRKLIEDRNVDPLIKLSDTVVNFNPSNLCLLRIMKSDIVCGIPKSKIEKFEKLSPDWMVNGQFGLIQFLAKKKEECDCLGI